MKKFLSLFFLFIVGSFLLSGCQWKFWQRTQQGNTPDQQGDIQTAPDTFSDGSAIKKFATLGELKEFLENNSSGNQASGLMRETGGDTWSDSFTVSVDSAMPMTKTMAPTTANEASGMGGSSDFSKTNVQIEGVDEADIVKTDGKYIYAVADKNLQIIEAYPADSAKLLTTIKFESQPQDIYINGNQLVVFGYDQAIFEKDFAKNFKRYSAYTFLKVFDISDKAKPKQLRDLSFEGSYHDSRLIGNYLYFITQTPHYGLMEGAVLPRLVEDGKLISVDANTDRYQLPSVYYFPVPYDSVNLVNVAAINVSEATEPVNSQVYLLPSNQAIFASKNNLYLTYTRYLNQEQVMADVMKEVLWPKLDDQQKDKITKIEAVEDFVLNKNEKLQKISQILQAYIMSLSDDEQKTVESQLSEAVKAKLKELVKEMEKTIITKIALDGKNLSYQATGEVSGYVLNQFAMDESGDYFRIATTKNQTWLAYTNEEDQKSFSNIYVLDKDLKTVGSVEGLAEGERIYSVRFMGQRAYLVTFKQTDPLFVVDLSQPTAPKILGELKIPGFSSYLHPYDDTTLIGLGKETIEKDGRVLAQGLKLSLFDVSNVSQPKEIAKYELGGKGSDSIALYDHKAFLFSKDKNLLAIPVSLNKVMTDDSWGPFEFGGLAVFDISKEGFKLKGKIDHSDGGKAGIGEGWLGGRYYDNSVKRALYIENNLYSLSSRYVKINKLGDLSEIKAIKLKDSKDFEVINY